MNAPNSPDTAAAKAATGLHPAPAAAAVCRAGTQTALVAAG